MTKPLAALAVCALLGLTACTHPQEHSDSYRQGYAAAHDYYAIPHNRDGFLNDDVANGYSTDIICQMKKAVAQPSVHGGAGIPT